MADIQKRLEHIADEVYRLRNEAGSSTKTLPLIEKADAMKTLVRASLSWWHAEMAKQYEEAPADAR